MKKVSILIGFCLLFAAYIGLSHAKDTLLTKSFNVESGGKLVMDVESGSIDIESHKGNTVKLLIMKRGGDADAFDFDFDQDGDTVTVTADKKGFSFFNNSTLKFIVKVPERFNLKLRTSGGSIKISSLKGEVDAYTSGGSIRLGDIVGDVEVKTSGGSIRVNTVDGNIKAHTSGGSIDVTFTRQPSEDCRLTTSGGSITAQLLSTIKVDLFASTSGGRVSTDFNVNGRIKKTKIDGEINGGGPKLTLKTSGGSVRIKSL